MLINTSYRSCKETTIRTWDKSCPFETVPDGSITTPLGFRAGGLHCGLKKTDRNDLGAIVCEVPAAAAAVYTMNQIQAARSR